MRARFGGLDYHVLKVALERVRDFATLFDKPLDKALAYAASRKAESAGCPIGSSECPATWSRTRVRVASAEA